MSDLLTHWAVFDDSCQLARHDTHTEPFFLEVLDDEGREMARLGALTRYGSRWMPHILQTLRDQKGTAEADARLRQKIAFALGGILHFPADQIFKPMMSELAQADWNSTHSAMQGRAADAKTTQNAVSIREISAYYDCHVFRKVYGGGQWEPFSAQFLAANATEPGQVLEAFVRSLFQRALLSCHTLAPDMPNFDEWLDRLVDKVPPLYIEIELYTRVFASPDAEKMAAYRVETDFYRDNDPIIQLARIAQSGGSLDAAHLEAALTPDANQSGYGECLRMGVQLLRGASAFWRGEQTEPPDVRQSTNWRRADAGAPSPS